jgi:voltage-gated potassium channel
VIRRGALTTFIDRHIIAWELVMGGFALAYLALSFLVDDGQPGFAAAVIVLAVIFVVEFVARFADAPSRLGYLRTHWLDLVSAIPLIGGLRSLRLLRLLRLGSGFRVLAATEHLTESRGRDRESMWFVIPTLLFTWFAAAAAYYVSEHGANPALRNFGDALYWAFTTATTLGYGATAPVTAAGHALAGLVIFGGVGIVGFTSARLAQIWLRDQSRHHPRLMLEKMTRMEQDMAEIRRLLEQQGRRDEQPRGSELEPAKSATRGGGG